MSAAIPFRARAAIAPGDAVEDPAAAGRTMALTLEGRTLRVAFAADGATRLPGFLPAGPVTELPALVASLSAATAAAATTEALFDLLAPLPRR